MRMDVRLPIGLMFAVLGVILVGYGLFGDNSVYQRSLGMNINAGWGAVMLLAGLTFLWLGRRGGRKSGDAKDASRGAHV